MGTKLINMHGREVLVTDERVEGLLKAGFTHAPEPAPPTPPESDERKELGKNTKAELAVIGAELGLDLDPDKLSKQEMIDVLVTD